MCKWCRELNLLPEEDQHFLFLCQFRVGLHRIVLSGLMPLLLLCHLRVVSNYCFIPSGWLGSNTGRELYPFPLRCPA